MALTYAAPVLYTAYNVLLYFLATREDPLSKFVSKSEHWADVGWYVGFISLSSGPILPNIALNECEATPIFGTLGEDLLL